MAIISTIHHVRCRRYKHICEVPWGTTSSWKLQLGVARMRDSLHCGRNQIVKDECDVMDAVLRKSEGVGDVRITMCTPCWSCVGQLMDGSVDLERWR